VNISSVSISYANTAVNPETVKQSSQADQQIQEQTETSDSLTISAAADEAFRSLSDKTSKAEGKTTVNSEQSESSAATDIKISTSSLNSAKISTESQAVDTELTSATTTNINASVEEETTSQTSAIVSETTSSYSEYTAAEIAEYDLDGDGEISTSEEAIMLAEQAKDASSDTSKVNSLVQTQSRGAYQTAIQQLQAPPANEYPFSLQV
jgi:hypothetical protein